MSLSDTIKIKLRPLIRPVVRFLMFYVYDTHVVVGSSGKLTIGKRCALANGYFNVSSGNITIGDCSILGPNVMVITGRHLFKAGRRASLHEGVNSPYIGGGPEEVPDSGYDITIGSGTWIAAGAIISGRVRIGNNVIIAANSVVTRDIPDYAVAAGCPAKIIGDTRNM